MIFRIVLLHLNNHSRSHFFDKIAERNSGTSCPLNYVKVFTEHLRVAASVTKNTLLKNYLRKHVQG